MGAEGAIFMQAPGSSNDHDIGLFSIGESAGPSEAGKRTVGLYHLAWEVDTLADLSGLAQTLAQNNALVGSADHGTTKSLYAKDPDGLEFEIAWIIPASRLDDATRAAGGATGRLDIEAEIERYGAETQGGVGISRPATVTS